MMLGRRRVVLAVITGLLFAGLATTSAGADDLGDQKAQAEKQQAATDRELAALREKLELTNKVLEDAYVQLQSIQARLPQAKAELTAAQDTLATAEREAAEIQARLEAAQAQEAQLAAQLEADKATALRIRDSVAELARQAYRGNAGISSLTLVLDSGSTTDFVEEYTALNTALRTQTRALDDLRQLGAVNRNREARAAAIREQISGLKSDADQKVAEAEAARKSAADREAEITQLLADQQQQAAIVESQKAGELAKLSELEAQRVATENTIKQIIQKQIEEEAARRKSTGTAKQAVGRGVLAYPTAVPYITSSYGMRFHPVLHIWRLHAGTDFRAYCGTPIYAAASGKVQWAQSVPGYGNQVMLNHGLVNGNALWTSYNHLSRFAVSTGQMVNKGQLVGYSGSTGTSTACHLHFEVYVDGNTVDPMTIL